MVAYGPRSWPTPPPRETVPTCPIEGSKAESAEPTGHSRDIGQRVTECCVRLLVLAKFVVEPMEEIGPADARPGCSGSLDMLASISIRPCDAGKESMRPAD